MNTYTKNQKNNLKSNEMKPNVQLQEWCRKHNKRIVVNEEGVSYEDYPSINWSDRICYSILIVMTICLIFQILRIWL
jgi:hypothetical protein